jgi:hypothetical protein
MISGVDLTRVQVVAPSPPHGPGVYLNALTGHVVGPDDMGTKIDLVIVGGESGSKARPFHVEWARNLRDQCKAAGVAFFMKQMGAHVLVRNDDSFNGDDEGAWPNPMWDQITFDPTEVQFQGDPIRMLFRDRAGADPSEWPEDLRIQQMPKEPT